MKAMIITPKVKGTLRQIDVPVPRPGAREALVRVVRLGMDGTDKEIGNGLYGEAPKGSGYLIIGHESFGVVENVGAQVKGIKPGDHVVATVRRPDNCVNCKKGESDMCTKGDYTERGIKGAHGYLSEYYKEDASNLVKIPSEIYDEAVMLEPFSIVEKAVTQISSIQKRMIWNPKNAIVLGTGAMGIFGAILLRQQGLDVVSVDRTGRDPVRDRIFKEFGVEHVNATADGAWSALESEGADVVLELTGNSAVVDKAISLQKINGVSCLLSVTGGSYLKQLDIERWNYNMVLGNRLVFGSVNSNKSHFVKGVKDMLSIEREHPGILPKMITTRLKLDRFKSYDALHKKGDLKTVIEVGED